MAVVIPFPPARRPASQTGAKPAPGSTAAILFFTGVRYERQPDPAPPALVGTRRERSAGRKAASRAKSARLPA